MQPSSSRHQNRPGMVASPSSLDVAKAQGIELFPKYNSLESLIYLAFDIVENQRVRHELRHGRVVADDVVTKLDTILQTHDTFAIANTELAEALYEVIDEQTTEMCPLFQFVIACTQQFYLHIGGQESAELIEDILSFGLGAASGGNSVIAAEALDGLPRTEDVKEILAANRWLVILVLYSLRPIHGSELVPVPKS